MSQSTTLTRTRQPLVLSDRPQVVKARTAAGIISRAKYVAVYVITGEHGQAEIFDVSKARVLKMVRRREKVWISELFGTIVVGNVTDNPI